MERKRLIGSAAAWPKDLVQMREVPGRPLSIRGSASLSHWASRVFGGSRTTRHAGLSVRRTKNAVCRTRASFVRSVNLIAAFDNLKPSAGWMDGSTPVIACRKPHSSVTYPLAETEHKNASRQVLMAAIL